MRKLVYTLIMVAIALCGLVFIGNAPISKAQKGINVSGIITQNMTWTASNGPYNFTGDVTVASGVTLTIQPGTEISEQNPNTNWSPDLAKTLNVNGTLRVEGTDGNLIDFASLNIVFSPSSTSWNNQTASGSIIQYCDFIQSIGISNASPKIDNNQVESIGVYGGSPIISNNVVITDMDIEAGSPTIYNNTITAESGGYPTELPAVTFEGQNTALFYGNHVIGDLSVTAAWPAIENNFISGSVVLSAGSPLVENNLIRYGGITVQGNSNPAIENNTIATNTIGINIYDSSGSPALTIAYNNFEQNSQYNIYLGQQGNYSSTAPNVNAANNWWGTTDLSIINQTIYDHKNNYNVGTVTFTPILTTPNTEATPNPNAPTPTPNPTQTPNPTSQPTTPSSQAPTTTPQQPSTSDQVLFGLNWDQVAIVGLSLAVVVLVAVALFYRGKSAAHAGNASVDLTLKQRQKS